MFRRAASTPPPPRGVVPSSPWPFRCETSQHPAIDSPTIRRFDRGCVPYESGRANRSLIADDISQLCARGAAHSATRPGVVRQRQDVRRRLRVWRVEKRFVRHPLRGRRGQRPVCNAFGMGGEGVRVGTPVRFDLSGEMRHRMSFNADAGNPQLFCTRRASAGAAERVKHALRRAQPEVRHISPHQMRRESRHEAIPGMSGTIRRRRAD